MLEYAVHFKPTSMDVCGQRGMFVKVVGETSSFAFVKEQRVIVKTHT